MQVRENCRPGRKIALLNGLRIDVVEGFFRGPAPVPESNIFGVKTRVFDHAATTFFVRLMEVWICRRNVCC